MPKRNTGNQRRSGFLVGLVFGLVLVVLYCKFGFQLPGWMQPQTLMENRLKSVVATMAADREDPNEAQRLAGILLGLDPAKYIECDNELGGFLTAHVIWQTFTRTEILKLRAKLKGMKERLDQYESLMPVWDRNLDDHYRPLVEKFLNRRFPGPTDELEPERLKRLSKELREGAFAEIVQEGPLHHAPILFRLRHTGEVRVEIHNGDDLVRTLVSDQLLPPGVYLMQWDMKDDCREKVPAGPWSYEVSAGGEVIAGESIPVPEAPTAFARKKCQGGIGTRRATPVADSRESACRKELASETTRSVNPRRRVLR
jgi:hypothetical protein